MKCSSPRQVKVVEGLIGVSGSARARLNIR